MSHPNRRTPLHAVVAGATALALPLALAATLVSAPSQAKTRSGPEASSPAPSARKSAVAAPANAANPSNPLAGRPWGVYKGNMDQAWKPYVNATGEEKEQLGKIALTPKAKWFGMWVSAGQIGDKVRDYIRNSQDGDPDALVQMADFHLKPWEHNACNSLPTVEQKKTYRKWTRKVAKALGDAHVAMIVQPDGPFALCAPGGSKVYSHLIRYAVRKYAAQPNTSVYIDAGASDWLRDDPKRARKILIPAGVEDARGFAFNSTHYVSTGRDLRFGKSVVEELASRGIPDKHFVINTSSNGKPFAGYTYKGPDFDNAKACKTTDDEECVTLGIPPTADVANYNWDLTGEETRAAAEFCDAYLWIGRPWLYRQADPFLKKRALKLVRTTPY